MLLFFSRFGGKYWTPNKDEYKNEYIHASFSNYYFKMLNGKTYQRGEEGFRQHPRGWATGGPKDTYSASFFVGDKFGNPVGKSSFRIDCNYHWKDDERDYGGPCHFRPTKAGKHVFLALLCLPCIFA